MKRIFIKENTLTPAFYQTKLIDIDDRGQYLVTVFFLILVT